MSVKCRIASPERMEFEGEARQVTFPSAEGDFGVLEGHAPVVAGLRAGKLEVESNQGQLAFFVGSGFVEVYGSTVMAVCEDVVSLENVDVGGVQADLTAAREQGDTERVKRLEALLLALGQQL